MSKRRRTERNDFAASAPLLGLIIDNRRPSRCKLSAAHAHAAGLIVLLLLLSSAAETHAFVVRVAGRELCCGWGDREASVISSRRGPTRARMIKEAENFEPGDGMPGSLAPELIGPDDEGEDYEEDWLPDREKARLAEEWNLKRAEGTTDSAEEEANGRPKSTPLAENHRPTTIGDGDADDTAAVDDFFDSPNIKKSRRLTYTDEEEELIAAMGGTSLENPSPKREPGYLGDSTIREISSDFQVPVCYLADVLCTWGVPVPINVDDRLGDLVTGEMAFALVEAIHTLDLGEVNDSYSNFDLRGLCFEFGIDLKDGFDFCVQEGWNLPFGVRTFLRVDQEVGLIKALSDDLVY